MQLFDLNAAYPKLTYLQFMSNMLQASADTATKIQNKTIGWFEEEKETMIPTIKSKNKLLTDMRLATGTKKDELRVEVKKRGSP